MLLLRKYFLKDAEYVTHILHNHYYEDYDREICSQFQIKIYSVVQLGNFYFSAKSKFWNLKRT